MKIPLAPPKSAALFNEIVADLGPEKVLELMGSDISKLPAGKYIHWDRLRYLESPEPYSHRDWWFAIKSARQVRFQTLPFKDKSGTPFQLGLPDFLLQKLHEIDRDASGRIELPEAVANPQTRDRFLVRSLMEEAITSSQLEGAATTFKDAKKMLRERRKPIDRSQRMILNNYNAMQFIREIRQEKFSRENILELHSILTEDTLDDASAVGRWRLANDDVKVVDSRDNTILHVPPTATEIEDRIRVLCDFANDTKSQPFIHPVIRSILVHFMLAYDHPFVDGNGRVARALFYWSMSSQRYWMIEFISISTILRSAPSKYARSYLYTETDENDTTYFVDYQLDIIRRSIIALHKYISRKSKEIRDADKWMRSSEKLRQLLNHRQSAILNHALKHPYETYTVKAHMNSQRVTYETARSDLQKLADCKLLEQTKRGRAYEYHVPEDLQNRLKNLRQAA